jgi:glyoxylase-like metal-dependent hydrolase (beta-lactamase superfamily II)
MAADLGFPAAEAAPFEPFEVDRTVADGETVRLSDGLTLKVIATPGHTRDSLSYYVPEKKILLPSEAVGIPDQTGYITIDCLVDYDLYHRSHRLLAALDVEVLCLGHRGVLTGADARRHMDDSLAQCERFRDMVGRFLRKENGDLERVKQQVKAYEYDDKPGHKQPLPAYLLNLDARVRAIARLDGTGERKEK